MLDFFCASSRLAIEIDGGVHTDEDAQMHDARRDEWLGRQGLRVLRIPEHLVTDNIQDALRQIAKACGR